MRNTLLYFLSVDLFSLGPELLGSDLMSSVLYRNSFFVDLMNYTSGVCLRKVLL